MVVQNPKLITESEKRNHENTWKARIDPNCNIIGSKEIDEMWDSKFVVNSSRGVLKTQ